jgi:hypothetical protein
MKTLRKTMQVGKLNGLKSGLRIGKMSKNYFTYIFFPADIIPRFLVSALC